jgi:metal-sulfur cluster biosynthetic enzyme
MVGEYLSKFFASKLSLLLLACVIAAAIVATRPSRKVEHEYHWVRAVTSESKSTAPISPDDVMKTLRNVRDPEIDMDIVDLGLIYNVTTEGSDAVITMTLTTPTCPFAPELIQGVKKEVLKDRVRSLRLTITYDPPWTIKRIAPEAVKNRFAQAAGFK